MSPSIRTSILFASLLWSSLLFALPPAANAGVIVQAPTYVGLSSGLVGYWSFNAPDMANDGNILTAYDRSGQGNNGSSTLGSTAPAPTAGRIGQALSLDGVNNYVEVPASSTFLPNNFTVSLWARPLNLSATEQIIIGFLNIPGNSGNNYIECAANQLLQTSMSNTDSGSWVMNVSGACQNGVWKNYAWTYDGAEGRLYVDGVLATSAAETGTSLSLLRIHFGSWFPNGFNFPGSIDDVRIYNRALSADEIHRLYKIGAGAQKAPTNLGLVGYWRFDEGAGTIAGDGSGNGNNGTLQGSPGPTWTNGRVGKALSFDGVDDYVNVPVSGIQLAPYPLTISAWVKTSVSVVYESFVKRVMPPNGSSSWDQGYNFLISSRNSCGIRIDTATQNNANNYPNGPRINDGRWHLCTATIESESASIYVDGNFIASQAFAGTFDATDGSFGFPTGNSAALGTATSSEVALDEVRIYNRALSAEEIRNLYESSKQVVVNSSQRNQLTNGLVGWWTFDGGDMAGNVAYDRSGSGNNGTLTADTGGVLPAVVAGKIGQGLYFDGPAGSANSNYVDIPIGGDLGFNNALTVSAWVKKAETLQGTASMWTVSRWGGSNDAFELDLPGPGENTAASWRVSNSGNAITEKKIYSTKNLTDFKWHHLVGVFNGSSQLVQLYVDGVLEGQAAAGFSTFFGIKTDIQIGMPPSISCCATNGRIDDVRIYNRALSADEIKRLYNMGR